MTLSIALLRAVNVAGRNMVAMAALRAAVEAVGGRNPRTLLQSGNVVFEAAAGEPEALLEAEIERRLALRIAVCVRTAAEWHAALAANPFPGWAGDDPGHLLVMALKTAPPAGALVTLRGRIVGREVVEIAGREAYLYYPDGVGTSKLTATVIERALGTAGTARNWNTCLKLAAMLPA